MVRQPTRLRAQRGTLVGTAVVVTGGATGSPPSFIFPLPSVDSTNNTHIPFFIGHSERYHVRPLIEDPDGDPMTIEAVTAMPAGITIDSANNDIVWSGSGVVGNTGNLQLRVLDNHGNSALSGLFNIQIFQQTGASGTFLMDVLSWPAPVVYGSTKLTQSKHIRMAMHPPSGRVYVNGGDYNAANGFGDSSRHETWSFGPATPNNWTLEFGYCATPGQIEPQGPDEASWSWDSTRNRFSLGPGLDGPSSTCSNGSITVRLSNHLTFDPVAKVWTDQGLLSPGNDSEKGYGLYVASQDQVIGGLGFDEVWFMNVADRTIGKVTTNTTGQFGVSAYVGYSEQSAYDGASTMYFYDYRGRLWKCDVATKQLILVMQGLPSASRLFLNMVWNSEASVLEVWVPQGSTGFGHLIVIDPAIPAWWSMGNNLRGNMAVHVPNDGTILWGGATNSTAVFPLTNVYKAKVRTSWVKSVPLNTWHQIPGTTYTADFDRSVYTAQGVLGRFGGIQEFGGFAPDRLNNRFLWGASGGGAGAHSGNDVGEFAFGAVPGVRLIVSPDNSTSLWANIDGSHALNKFGRPNSSHANRSLLYSPRSHSLFKFTSGQVWENDAGNFGNTFQAVVEPGSLGAAVDWVDVATHPDITNFNGESTLDWRLTDWRNGDLYVAHITRIYKYDEQSKTFVNWLSNPTQTQIGRGATAILESANVMFLLNATGFHKEIDLNTGTMIAATISGSSAASIIEGTTPGLASDPVGNCLWYFRDNQKLFKLVRTGAGTWDASEHILSGTPPALYESGIRNGSEGIGPGIYNGFDFFPQLGGLAWVSRTDRPVYFVRLYS